MNTKNKIIFGMILFVLLFQNVDAKFVCGEVSTHEEISPSWINVDVYYTEDSSKRISCDVSPDGNKYCCDVESIGKSWNIGDSFSAEIFDKEFGYFADEVSLISTGEGYDVFPVLQLKKVINIYNKKFIFSENPVVKLNFSFEEPYTSINLNGEVLCEDCTSFVGEINGSFGMNSLLIEASDGINFFEKDLEIFLIKSFEFDKLFDKKKVKENEELLISFNLNLSHEIFELTLKEYIPNEWKILETDGIIRQYSDTHKVISWNVSGKNIYKKYLIKSPNIGNIPQTYNFYTELEDEILEESKVKVFKSNVLSFLPSIKNERRRGGNSRNFLKVSPSNPAFIETNNLNVAIFPSKPEENIYFKVINSSEEDFIFYFDSDIENITKIFIDLDIDKKEIKKKGYNNPKIFFEEDGWVESSIDLIETETSFSYRGYIPSVTGLAIMDSELNLPNLGIVQNVLMFFKNLFQSIFR